MNARNMKKRWPFPGSDAYLDTSLEDIREGRTSSSAISTDRERRVR